MSELEVRHHLSYGRQQKMISYIIISGKDVYAA